MEKPFILELTGIHKSFGPVKVLEDVSFNLRPGEVHALLGENGAGKSTLMKILSGFHGKDQGSIRLNGSPVEIATPRQAITLGIAEIYQELNLVPTLTVAENIFLGREPRHGRSRALDWAAMRQGSLEALARLGLRLDPGRRVDALSVAEQQMVEIAKALSTNARILIMDEPTSALTQREIDSLFHVIRQLRSEGVGIIYISHKLDEVFALADRITVLRDGRLVGTYEAADLDHARVIQLMVGRELSEMYPKVAVERGEAVLSVRGLTRRPLLADVTFDLHAGEILGVTGLMGAGKTELATALFGSAPADSGQISLQGRPVRLRRPADAISAGISLVPEDRKTQGVILNMSVQSNVTLPFLRHLRRLLFLDGARERQVAQGSIDRLRIKVRDPWQDVSGLSGGNQQKVALAKWLTHPPKVLVFDEPTRGIDVGAKTEIYRLMGELAERGIAILMFTSEMPELLGMSDRILVLHRGRVAAEFSRNEATQEEILEAAMGGKADVATGRPA
ncbi:MAG: sugar ABC transporter ATP-binding protein [Bacillota bacterium]